MKPLERCYQRRLRLIATLRTLHIGVLQVSHDYFENAMAFFTVNIYTAIKVALLVTIQHNMEDVKSQSASAHGRFQRETPRVMTSLIRVDRSFATNVT